ncbi:hypothetical protein Xaut_4866 (plasmid) [Xanthobacter versatilis]|uniref:Zinc ribbon domain-containing protein n=2 Tax=Xanthobacter TaxID=279 RepID=A7IPY1_XANP2|nr:hypothetical protein Xaut_4866 [Xanthobacter autotrophicus Py2]CAA56242.1 orf2 [Xanthobacter autotrophicus Py2]
MPVYTIKCPDCGHVFRGMVMEGTRKPRVWVCSQCKSERPQIMADRPAEPHPFECTENGGGCLCCGR